ncbi:MAG: farnesyl diphosphate synthase [Succiniclasticum sp.]|jgi:polyprenyl synthetase|nr:polyprenyl synthetase family protein [Selenomonadales bacterium]MDY2870326.1 farnesyl diphosphate synthase [Succiniclasticum sp.]MDY6302754.1 farnesyl diphosphate synthase [Succiniclasticum sp.]MDY6346320.1 farnesyl diphosphate synthase [Succiniclasticum sp.]
MALDFEKYYESRKQLVDNFLEKRMQKRGISNVDDAMKYSLLAGGKRLRPILLMATADALGANGYDFLTAACGLEMIHTYSLIHDDLPCMDNDDYRRGRLTNHKVFGEALALLAGDGLLTLAFEVMAEQRNVKPSTLVEFIHETAMCAGNFGMVGGQALDLEAEGRAISAKELKTLHEGKTGAMFIAAVRGGAHLAGATEEQLLALTRFAELVGLAFQIEDDILDVTSTQEELGKPIGSDAKNEKSTYVSLFGLEEARKMADETTEEALRCLDMFGEKADALRELAKLMCHRRS